MDSLDHVRIAGAKKSTNSKHNGNHSEIAPRSKVIAKYIDCVDCCRSTRILTVLSLIHRYRAFTRLQPLCAPFN